MMVTRGRKWKRIFKTQGKRVIIVTATFFYVGLLLRLHQSPEFSEGLNVLSIHQGLASPGQNLDHPGYIDVTGNVSRTWENFNGSLVFKGGVSRSTVQSNTTKEINKEAVFLPQVALGEMASGLMKYPHPTYIRESRNPCFYVNVTTKVKGSKLIQVQKVLHCLPLVYLAGFAKAGSSDLHNNIIQHQHIIPGLMKEPQYWFHSVQPKGKVSLAQMLSMYGPITQLVTKYFLNSNSSGAAAQASASKTLMPKKNKYKRPPAVSLMPELVMYREKGQPSPLITLDSSPMYMYEAINWEKDPLNLGMFEPKILAPHKIRHFLDHPKIIVLMRDPVERLFSDFRFFAEGKYGSELFHTLVVNGTSWWKKCVRELPLYKCAYGRNYTGTSVTTLKPDGFFDWGDTAKYGYNGANRVRFSIYVIYIKKWLEVFPRECFLFVKSEEYSKDPIKVLTKQIYPFLELEPLTSKALANLETLHKRGHINKTPKVKFSMLPETRQLLQDFYKPYNEQLVTLLGDDRFKWY